MIQQPSQTITSVSKKDVDNLPPDIYCYYDPANNYLDDNHANRFGRHNSDSAKDREARRRDWLQQGRYANSMDINRGLVREIQELKNSVYRLQETVGISYRQLNMREMCTVIQDYLLSQFCRYMPKDSHPQDLSTFISMLSNKNNTALFALIQFQESNPWATEATLNILDSELWHRFRRPAGEFVHGGRPDFARDFPEFKKELLNAGSQEAWSFVAYLNSNQDDLIQAVQNYRNQNRKFNKKDK